MVFLEHPMMLIGGAMLGGAMLGGAMIVRPMVAPGQGDEPVPDDAGLMARFATGDGPAFEALYRRHRGVLYNYIRRLTPPGDAEEIFQDVWMAVVKSSSQYVPSARFTTFLFAIAHRRIADFYRRRGRRREDVLSEELRDEAQGPEAMAQNAALGAALSAAVGQLPREQREAFLLRAEAGLSVEEIAAVTGVPYETAKSRLRYANRVLREKLDAWK
jgi:RNA polymerase sigma-70 factor (ECF subfamily)